MQTAGEEEKQGEVDAKEYIRLAQRDRQTRMMYASKVSLYDYMTKVPADLTSRW